MKWISVSGIREAEAIAFAQRNLPSYTAMCRAGAAVARRAQRIVALANLRTIVVLAGPGNNGGDGFVAARCLAEDGYQVEVCLTCVPARLKGDAARAWHDLQAAGVPARILPSADAWQASPWLDPAVAPRRALLIDALLGIGSRGVPVGPVAAAIHWVNGTSADCPVLSVDVPSGLDADAGTAPGEAVRADATITFSRPKLGFSNPAARPYIGDLTVADIGIPGDLLDAHCQDASDGVELLAAPEIRTILRPDRRLDSHKRSYGHACVVGGCERYPHAPILSALAAYRAGCGLVTLAVNPCSRPAAAHWVPEDIFAAT
ncbi:MAG: NAD(P)H-hydrate epimerase, partial [Candidatus Spyradenecus sp.]